LKLTADEALLFRFSALTYNAHRIHYDHNWVREEGYRCLVVHGPLQALMMGELIRSSGDGLVGKQFAYRLVAPMIGSQTFTVLAEADGVNAGVEACDVHGTVTAVGTVGPIDPEQSEVAAMPFNYSVEAARYDVTRGGQERVQAAAVAIAELLPHPGTLLDVAAEPSSSAIA